MVSSLLRKREDLDSDKKSLEEKSTKLSGMTVSLRRADFRSLFERASRKELRREFSLLIFAGDELFGGFAGIMHDFSKFPGS